MPIISVIIPVYNVEKYLRRCLDSVLAQTFQDWQAICINDGSPDNSGAILEEYAARDPRFKIITKENTGLSDTRNIGMKHASGEYVMYLDSDDLIHPQTMGIALSLAKRDNSDIVSWYKDGMFRPQLLVRHRLGLDIDSAMPRGIKKKYKLEKIKSFLTDNVFAHATERSHTRIKWPIRHNYVWCHLLRRELIKDVDFIKGIIFEDFPWWSAVLLRRPKVTITNLPFYYYFPNFNSVTLKNKESQKMRNWLIGLEYSYKLYKDQASDYEMNTWNREFMWPVIIYQVVRRLKYVDDEKDLAEIRAELSKFDKLGMFDNPPNFCARRYRRKIRKFIKPQDS
ncbi:MAG: glycosyltransferase [Rickettsiales bacterium]|jgi:glycosyltransferase involved in cell wall biosynthesis|nr:glycosyltransferase [Rickettsiales bacterium]